MDAAESQRAGARRIADHFGFAFRYCARGGGFAAAELKLVVEKQGATGAAFLHGEGGESAIFGVKFDHAAEIDIADDVDIVKEERLAG